MEFENFSKWATNNGYKKNLDLDRIDNDKGYNPENCRWVTRTINNRNRRNTIKIEGVSLKEISEMYDLKYSTVINRYYEMKKENMEITIITIITIINYANQLPISIGI